MTARRAAGALALLLLLAGCGQAQLDETLLEIEVDGPRLERLAALEVTLSTPLGSAPQTQRYPARSADLPGTLLAGLPDWVSGPLDVRLIAADGQGAPLAQASGTVDIVPRTLNHLSLRLERADAGPPADVPGDGPDGGDAANAADAADAGDAPDAGDADALDAGDADDAPDGADAPDGTPVVPHASCAEVRADDPTAADGTYTLYVEGDPSRPWTAYCHDMDQDPVEYLPLVHRGSATGTSADPVSAVFVNYSQFRGGDVTFFDRVRIDPVTLRVDIGDLTFARPTGATGLPFAVSYGCDTGGGPESSSANVDLRGTPFTVDPSQFGTGPDGAGEVHAGAGGQVLQIDGYSVGRRDACGWIRPEPVDEDPTQPLASSFQLQLTYRRPPASCAHVKEDNPGAIDGEYDLFVGGDIARPWRAYCADMATDTPREYLTLPRGGSGENFSLVPAGGTATGTDLLTRYRRLRIDPRTLVVDIADRRFATSTGALTVNGAQITSLPYAVAGDCDGGGPGGRANVNLRGTPFAVMPDGFTTTGSAPSGTATYRGADRIVELQGGGGCGFIEPRPGTGDPLGVSSSFVLALRYAPLPRSCAQLKAEVPGAQSDGDYVIYHAGDPARPLRVYCRNQATTPREYLTLVQDGSGRNFARVRADGSQYVGTDVVSSYSRVRIDPETLLVDIADRTFASSTGSINGGGISFVFYGTAADCAGAFQATGTGNIDLQGTPLVVAPGAHAPMGYLYGGSTTYSAAGQVVDIAGGGFCGENHPQPGGWQSATVVSRFSLRLEYPSPPPPRIQTILVSVAPDGSPGNGASNISIERRAISQDGRFVVFDSVATNLVAGDSNSRRDVFIRDLVLGTTRLVSHGPAGVPANGDSFYGSISADGRYVAYDSAATNIVSGTSGHSIFVWDRLTDTTRAVVTNGSGAPLACNECLLPKLSSDGRFVAFSARSSLVPAVETNGEFDVFVRDLAGPPGVYRIASVSTAGMAAQAGPGTCSNGAAFSTPNAFVTDISPDGRLVTFGSELLEASDGFSLSPDGSLVVFQTQAPVVSSDTNGAYDVYLRRWR